MKVTALKKQVKNPQRVSVFVDGKYSFSLSLDELLAQRLKNGQELDDSAVKRLKKISADGKLRARTLEWLLNRPHSTRELRDYLFRKKAEPEQIDNLVDEFSSKGYVDDGKYALWLMEIRQRAGKSDRAIRAELFKKGVDREVIDGINAGSGSDEASRLKILIAKKQKLARYQKEPDKLFQYLARQGFDWQLIKSLLRDKRPENEP